MKGIRFLRCAAGAAGSGCGAAFATADSAASSSAAASAGSSTSGSSTLSSANSTLHSFRTRDITLRIPSKDHLVRVSFCSTRYLLAETIRRHSLLRVTGANLPFLQLLGTQLTFTNLLASAQEGEERVETRLTSDEATILTEALALGECRCYLRPEYNAQLEAEGQPTFPLRVNRILYRQRAPFSSLVHADLAELLQPPIPTSSDGHVKDAEGGAVDHTVPFSLFTPTMVSRVPLDAWTNFFAYNSTLHAYNYLRRSDGCVPAVWLHTALDAAVLRADDLLDADGTPLSNPHVKADVKSPDSKEAEKVAEAQAQALQRTLRHAIPHSFGVIVTPLAAGDAVERQVGQLNRVLMEAAVLLHAPPTSGRNASSDSGGAAASASPLQSLLERCKEKHTTCQHILSLLTGDHEGAHASAVAARQYSEDPAQVAAVVDPIRRAMGVADFVLPLAATEAVRTGLDFFCRCSKQNIVSSLTAAPASALTSLKENDGVVNCSFCGKHYQLTVEDWAELEKARAAPPAPPSR
ncbi:putative mitochondrial hypothetical protein [Leptomonas pyrrhocoris]|uniref:Uncharacterized protein n=1 Tax=Leptomonas pyrrhocoris TaxID=157538 RepID=A0A0N0DXP6_LEPPY|nr:putative mitochondrial hypothetical protein [Leptomonas pyrrhocoris]XP_015661631.1 putative mitochondrial hypothetical protein [Leptomonas pyrrhocoris]KPA83191.1 putative mitochondrial hypothetical protein [Leptomonas pyrrhocoris]KPA83192.1 putative mitochondrial hypothetical protein [Leptomonas pyrrhocoris]|eukprot:XP_015661630.1 putative mitochondrial hypothetical protein [Leptomonas pyrrhocoris]